MRREAERLQDILDAIVAIERYASQGRQAFDEQELIQVWVIHHLQIIGEAASSLSGDLMNRYSSVPWAQIVAFRNVVVHEYFLRITEGSLKIGLKCPVRKPKLLVERPCKFIGFGTFKRVETLSLNSNELIPK
jgi:uncharacterized protein with HEPN domain